MAPCIPAETCKRARSELTSIAPGRSIASDGICASPQHTGQNPNSDHERGEAVDLTHDPAHGVSGGELADLLVRRRDPRVKYIIWSYAMISSYAVSGYPAWTWRPYHGTNPHTKHVHISILRQYRNDTRPWWTGPIPPSDDDQENDEMKIVLVQKDPSPDGKVYLMKENRLVHVRNPSASGPYHLLGLDQIPVKKIPASDPMWHDLPETAS